MKAYAGIGSRTTPGGILCTMRELAAVLSGEYVLRSGGADGADTAFYLGIPHGERAEFSEIYLPSPKFAQVDTTMPGMIDATSLPAWRKALETVDRYHPTAAILKPFTRKLMARNAIQVLGRNLDDPVEFVVCWTPEGRVSGGTGQALRIALDYGIPIRNLGDPATLENARSFLKRRRGGR